MKIKATREFVKKFGIPSLALLSLSKLKEDYFSGGKLTENTRFCLFMLSVGKKEELGEEKCSERLF